jgi:hypothetical protein
MDWLAAAFGLYAVALGHLGWGITAVVLSVVLKHIYTKDNYNHISSGLDIILSSFIVLYPADTFTTASLIILCGSEWTTK